MLNLTSMLCLKSKLNPMLYLKKITRTRTGTELEHEQLVKGVNKCELEKKNTVS